MTDVANPDFTDPSQFAPGADEGTDEVGNRWALTGNASLDAPDVFVPFPPAIDLDGLATRVDRFAYDLLDPSLNRIGELHPVVVIDGSNVAPQIRTSVQGNVARRLDSLTLLPTDAAAINARTDRIRPSWVDQDGTAYPLGVYRVVDATVVQFSGGDRVEMVGADESSSHRSRIPRSLSWARDTPGADMIDELAGLLDIAELDADVTLAALGEPLAFPIGSADWGDVYAKVAEALGLLPPHFTNAGAWRWRHVPDWEAAEPDHVYSTDPSAPSSQRRVIQHTLTRSVSLFDAPNTWIATNTGATAAAIVGRYTLPDSAPNSVARIGVEVLADPIDNVGFAGPDAATAAARAAAATALDDIGSASFSAPLDARHDLYDLIEADRYRYREVGVQGRLAPGERFGHSLRRVYLTTDDDGAYLSGAL